MYKHFVLITYFITNNIDITSFTGEVRNPLFCYSTGKGQKDHTNAAFVPNFLDSSTMQQKNDAKVFCGKKRSCQLDYIITHRTDFAKSTADIEQQFEDDVDVLGKIINHPLLAICFHPPTITTIPSYIFYTKHNSLSLIMKVDIPAGEIDCCYICLHYIAKCTLFYDR